MKDFKNEKEETQRISGCTEGGTKGNKFFFFFLKKEVEKVTKSLTLSG